MAASQTDKEHQRVMRDLRQQGQAAVTWGLPNPATEAAVLGMGLVIRDRMSTGNGNDRAAAAAELAAVMLDKTLGKMPQSSSVQCTKGCSFCCHATVTASAPEVFRAARIVQAQEAASAAGTAAVVSRAKARSAASVEALLSLRDPCPLLIEGNCSVYDGRPMGCRQFLSTDVDGCRAAFQRGSGDLPYIPAAANAGLIVRSLLMASALSLQLKVDNYELSSALAIALSTQDAEARWLAGEDVLAGAQKIGLAPNMKASGERWGGMLIALFE